MERAKEASPAKSSMGRKIRVKTGKEETASVVIL